MFAKSLLGMLAVLAAGPVWAGTTIFDCTVKEVGRSGWVPQRLVIQHDQTSGEVLVVDNFIIEVYSKPIAATISTDNAARTTFTWAIKSDTNAQGQFVSQFQYRATVQKGSNEVVVSAVPVGYSDVLTGQGTCAVSAK